MAEERAGHKGNEIDKGYRQPDDRYPQAENEAPRLETYAKHFSSSSCQFARDNNIHLRIDPECPRIAKRAEE